MAYKSLARPGGVGRVDVLNCGRVDLIDTVKDNSTTKGKIGSEGQDEAALTVETRVKVVCAPLPERG